VKKLEKRSRSRTHKLKRLYKVGLTARVESSKESLGQKENVVEEVVDAAKVSTAATTITTEEITLAQALEALKTSKPKDKGKRIMVKPEKPMKKKDQISFDEETGKRLQAEFDEEKRLAREKAEKNKKLILP
ncbi:hypothetical protein Tco_0258466, partial [Tanacetum coccineum]